jgi:hypothetical protein
VTDAVEIGMEGASRDDDSAGVAVAVCARRTRGATCWTADHGRFVANEAPELASAVKLYSGPAVCGASASGALRCVRFQENTGSIPGFSEDEYDKYIYRWPRDVSTRNVIRVLTTRLGRALAAHRKPDGFHASGKSDTVGRIGPALGPPHELSGAVELRRLEWGLNWDGDRVRGALCARRSDGTVVCWGERDYLGADQHSTRDTALPVAGLVVGPPRHVALPHGKPGHAAPPRIAPASH